MSKLALHFIRGGLAEIITLSPFLSKIEIPLFEFSQGNPLHVSLYRTDEWELDTDTKTLKPIEMVARRNPPLTVNLGTGTEFTIQGIIYWIGYSYSTLTEQWYMPIMQEPFLTWAQQGIDDREGDRDITNGIFPSNPLGADVN